MVHVPGRLEEESLSLTKISGQTSIPKKPQCWFNLQWSPCGKALFFAGKSPTCLVHHRSVSVKHPSRTSTLLDVFIMCVLMNIAFCSSNISCAGPHQQTLFVGPKYVCSARTINRDILFPYHHIISLPKKTSTNITPFGHGSKCLEVAWGRRPRWSVACATAPCWVQWWDGSKRCRWWIPIDIVFGASFRWVCQGKLPGPGSGASWIPLPRWRRWTFSPWIADPTNNSLETEV